MNLHSNLKSCHCNVHVNPISILYIGLSWPLYKPLMKKAQCYKIIFCLINNKHLFKISSKLEIRPIPSTKFPLF